MACQADWPDRPDHRATRRGGAADQPTHRTNTTEQPGEAGLSINLPNEQPSEVGWPTNLPADQPSEAGLPTNLPTEQPNKMTVGSQVNTTTGGKSRSSTINPWWRDGIDHHQAMSRSWKRYRRVSIKHNARYVSPLTSGSDNPSHRDLSIRVSTVTHMLEGMGQYALPGIHLCMMKGDAKGMTEDEVVLKTSLNLTSNWLDMIHQALLRLYQNSYRNPLANGRDTTPYQEYYHTRFWKVKRMQTMYMPGSEIHVYNDYITGHHHTVLK
jgi:hypothetical protein